MNDERRWWISFHPSLLPRTNPTAVPRDGWWDTKEIHFRAIYNIESIFKCMRQVRVEYQGLTKKKKGNWIESLTLRRMRWSTTLYTTLLGSCTHQRWCDEDLVEDLKIESRVKFLVSWAVPTHNINFKPLVTRSGISLNGGFEDEVL